MKRPFFYVGVQLLLESKPRNEHVVTGNGFTLYTGEDTLFEEKLRKMVANIRFAGKSVVYW